MAVYARSRPEMLKKRGLSGFITIIALFLMFAYHDNKTLPLYLGKTVEIPQNSSELRKQKYS